MLPWYHLHSNVKTFLIRPITGSSVVSYYCSLVQKRCLEATFCHCLAKTPSSLWVSLSVGACCILLFRTTLSRIILAKMGAVVKGCLVFQWVASIGITLCSVGAFATTNCVGVSICQIRRSDTHAFVPTSRQAFLPNTASLKGNLSRRAQGKGARTP